MIRFKDSEGWSKDVAPKFVHEQMGISFIPPPYKDHELEKPKEVFAIKKKNFFENGKPKL